MPCLTDGIIDIETLSWLLDAAFTVLSDKGVEEDKHIPQLLNCFNNNRKVQTWVTVNGPTLTKLAWDEFRLQLYNHFGGSDWDIIFAEKLRRARQSDFTDFADYVDNIASWNCELIGTPHYMSDDALVLQACSGLSNELWDAACEIESNTFNKWVADMGPIVKHISCKQRSLKHAAELLLEEHCSKQSSSTSSSCYSSTVSDTHDNRPTSSCNNSIPSSSARPWCSFPPTISDEEHEYTMKMMGAPSADVFLSITA